MEPMKLFAEQLIARANEIEEYESRLANGDQGRAIDERIVIYREIAKLALKSHETCKHD